MSVPLDYVRLSSSDALKKYLRKGEICETINVWWDVCVCVAGRSPRVDGINQMYARINSGNESSLTRGYPGKKDLVKEGFSSLRIYARAVLLIACLLLVCLHVIQAVSVQILLFHSLWSCLNLAISCAWITLISLNHSIPPSLSLTHPPARLPSLITFLLNNQIITDKGDVARKNCNSCLAEWVAGPQRWCQTCRKRVSPNRLMIVYRRRILLSQYTSLLSSRQLDLPRKLTLELSAVTTPPLSETDELCQEVQLQEKSTD